MSDKTPIEELRRLLFDSDVIKDEFRYMITELNKIQQNYVTKEQHKEDVVKARAEAPNDEIIFFKWDGSAQQEAEQYYNENHKQ